MTKVITYGTYDVLHYGHIRLLERAKALGDYLIVGVTSDDYDITRGKINNKQSLVERMENVRKLGIADEIIVEEYEGQKLMISKSMVAKDIPPKNVSLRLLKKEKSSLRFGWRRLIWLVFGALSLG